MSVELKVRTELGEVFLDEAKARCRDAKKAFESCCQKVKKQSPVHQELWYERQNSAFAIMLSVFATEAYINMIGHDKLDPEIWKELERLKLEKKWFLIPKLISGKTFDRDDPLFKNFIRIIDLRNYLVHYKDYEPKEFVNHDSGIKVSGIHEYLSAKNAELACTTAEKMIKQLNKYLGI